MTSPYFCQCCGCVSGDVLPSEYAYGSLFNIGGRIIDNPQSFGASTVTADVQWTRTGVGNSTTICGGSSTVDARANSLRMDLTWSPFVLRSPLTGSVPLTYDSKEPPNEAEKIAEARIAVYNTEAVFQSVLAQRELPKNFFQVWAIGYEDHEAYWAETFPFEPTPQFGVNKPPPYGEAFYSIPIQQSARPSVNLLNDPPSFARRAFIDLPEVADAISATPAHAGTSLNGFKSRTLTGLGSYVTYTELCSLRFGTSGSWVGWAVTATDHESGFDQKTQIQFAGQSRLVNFRTRQTAQPVGITTYVAPGSDDDVGAQAVVTAYVNRGAAAGFSDDFQSPFSAKRTQIYRDGVEVLNAIEPTQQQIDDAMLEEGSYLFVYTTTGTLQHGPPNGVRIRPSITKEFDSAVVDNTPPALGFKVPPDGYEVTIEEPYYAPANEQVILFSTEPLITTGAFFNGVRPFVCFPDEQPDGVTARPSLRNNIDANLMGGPTTLRGITSTPMAGTYTVAPIEENAVQDLAGNFPAVIPSVQVTIHERPEDNHLGATPTIQDPGLLTREYYRTRLQHQKVTSLRLTFDRKVVASEVDSSQLRLLKDGVEVGGCRLEQAGDSGTEWEITIPEEPQTERAFMVLEYDPAGDVHTDDIVTITYASQDRFPQTGKPRVVYQFQDGQAMRRFSWGRRQQGDTLGYVELDEDEPPIDEAGYPYDPEPCVLASRVSWLMADSRGWPRKIDVSSVTGQIGRVASVTDEREISKEAITSTVSGNGGMLIPQSLGTFSPLLNYRGYVPCVPPPTDPPADCSYFGLTTTIDPCPPAEVSPCAAPRVAQRHASAIISDEDINSIGVQVVAFEPATTNPKNWASYAFEGDFANASLFWPGDADFTVIPGSTTKVTNLAAVLLSRVGAPFNMSSTLEGVPASQNVWFSIGQPGSASVPIAVKYSRFPNLAINYGTDPGNYFGLVYQKQTAETPPGFPEGWAIVFGQKAGLVRLITSASAVNLAGAFACLSASRECRTYTAMQTTTLGELQLRISMRLVVNATIVYQDRRLGPTKFVHPNPAMRTQLYDYDPSLMDPFVFPGGFGNTFPVQLTGVQKLADATTENTKTVSHDFLLDVLEDRIVLSREQERRFAEGQAVYYPVARIADGSVLNASFYWKLKRG